MRSTGPASPTSPGAWQLRGPAAHHPGSAGIRVQASGPPFPAQLTPALGMGLGICLSPQTENGTLLPGDKEVAWILHRHGGPSRLPQLGMELCLQPAGLEHDFLQRWDEAVPFPLRPGEGILGRRSRPGGGNRGSPRACSSGPGWSGPRPSG